MIEHYQESAFFIHPNIWEETFCVSMAEAMKCGCYPIITNIGALPEVATENFLQLFPWKEPEQLKNMRLQITL